MSPKFTTSIICSRARQISTPISAVGKIECCVLLDDEIEAWDEKVLTLCLFLQANITGHKHDEHVSI